MSALLIVIAACGPDDGEATPPRDPVPDPTPPAASPTDTYTDGTWTTTVDIEDRQTLARTYTLSTDHPQRDGGPQQITVVEEDGQTVLRSGNDVLDALFALAIQEARACAVSEVTDLAFGDGAPVACDCFETGESWTWVWTRDTAYAVDLGLAWLDPQRAAASMRFKLSAPKPGVVPGGTVVVQDTGSGGSWPVSTDRLVWVFGALQLLQWLDGAERDAFLDDAYEALSNTVEQDLAHTVDPSDGLIRGETSFLDWREQTYAPWTATDTARIAETKALSTNVGYLVALRALSDWAAVRGDAAASDRYADLATALEPQLAITFAQGDGWASFTGGPLDPTAAPARDLLGTALAALHATDTATATALVGGWPHGPLGPPVIWPQRSEAPIYHNRAQWPFVTAYLLRAARHARHDGAVVRGTEALVRGAALNLSNLENFEWATQAPWFDDGDRSGPVVNSRRQLWSVAGFLSLVVDGVFGLEAQDGVLQLSPWIPAEVAERWLGAEVVLHRLPFRGRSIDVHLQLPAAPGSALEGDAVTWQGDVATVSLRETGAPPVAVTEAIVGEDLAPPTPTLTVTDSLGHAQLTFDGGPADILRDGVVVATEQTGTWRDPSPGGDQTACYTIESVGPTGLRAHRAQPQCHWQDDRVQSLSTWTLSGDGAWAEDHGRPHVADWGRPTDALEVWFRPWFTGPHLVQWVYANGANGVTTGLTAGHKRLRVHDAAGLVAEGAIVMPHTGGWDAWRDSTALEVILDAGTSYRLELMDAPNMSGLEAHASYTGGPGGGPASSNFVDLAEVKVLSMGGPGGAPALAVVQDGEDDLDGFPPDQVQIPGVPLQPWEAVGFEWDDTYLYLTLVAEAFDDPYAPWMIYLQVDPVGLPAAGPGMPYSGLEAWLPFAPTHLIAARVEHDAGDGLGPWSGVWVPDGAGDWTQRARFEPGANVWVAGDHHTLSVQVHRALIDDATDLRLAAHVVRGLPGNEYKDTWPAAHSPWADGGTHLRIDLSGGHDASAWQEE